MVAKSEINVRTVDLDGDAVVEVRDIEDTVEPLDIDDPVTDRDTTDLSEDLSEDAPLKDAEENPPGVDLDEYELPRRGCDDDLELEL